MILAGDIGGAITRLAVMNIVKANFNFIFPGMDDDRGNRVVVSAGTGLGEAVLITDGREYRPFASEGGHADFAPRNHLEKDLLSYLLKRHSRVSDERLISGQGLVNIYQFLKDWGNVKEPVPYSDLSVTHQNIYLL